MIKEIKEIYENIKNNYDVIAEKKVIEYLNQYEVAFRKNPNKEEIINVVARYFSDEEYKQMRLAAIKGFLQQVSDDINQGYYVNTTMTQPLIIVSKNFSLELKKMGWNDLNLNNLKIGSKKLEITIKKYLLHFPLNYTIYDEDSKAIEKYFNIQIEHIFKENLYTKKSIGIDEYISDLESPLNRGVFDSTLEVMKSVDKTRYYPSNFIPKESKDKVINEFFDTLNKEEKTEFVKGLITKIRLKENVQIGHESLHNLLDFTLKNNDFFSCKDIVDLLQTNNEFLDMPTIISGVGMQGYHSVEIGNKYYREDKQKIELYIKNKIDIEDMSFLKTYLNDNTLSLLLSGSKFIYGIIEQEKIRKNERNIDFGVDCKIDKNKVELLLAEDFWVNIKNEYNYLINELVKGMGGRNYLFKIDKKTQRIRCELTFDEDIIFDKNELIEYVTNFFQEIMDQTTHKVEFNGILSTYRNDEEMGVRAKMAKEFYRELTLLNKMSPKKIEKRPKI